MIEDIVEEFLIVAFDIFFKYKITSIGAALLLVGLISKIFSYAYSNWLIILGIIIVIFGFIIKK